VDHGVKDVRAWLLANLDAEVRPGFETIWNRRVLLQTNEMPSPIDEPGR
jgi:hypothetical protein